MNDSKATLVGVYVVDKQHGWVYRIIDDAPRSPSYLVASNGQNHKGGYGFSAFLPKDMAEVLPNQAAAARYFRQRKRLTKDAVWHEA